MARTPVVSNMMTSVGYAPRRRTLEIEFIEGGIYEYYGVPPEVYDELLVAPSKGRYFHERIFGRYSYRRKR